MTKKKAAREQAEKHLPQTPPKKTGKRGVGPKPDGEREFTGTLAEQDTARQASEQPAAEPLKVPGAKKPRQARLPEMEDPEIEELENAAQDYASIRDERIALNQDEHKLKEKLLSLMKVNKKERYHRDGIEVKLVHENETVKVRVKKTEENE